MEINSQIKHISSTLLITLTLLSNVAMQQQTQCSDTQGCYPPIGDLFQDMSNRPMRTFYASSTCGVNSTNGVQYRSILSSDPNIYTCEPASLQPINVLDDETGGIEPTYWQSENMIGAEGEAPKQQFLVFNFTDEFLIHEIQIKFAVPHLKNSANSANARPAALTIEKMDASSQDWTVLHHFALNCAASFPGVPILDPFSTSLAFSTVYCQQYFPIEEGQPYYDDDNWVDYRPGFFFGGFQSNMAAVSRYSASALRLLMLSPAKTSPLQSYVAVSQVFIDGQCKCFGHASSCGGENGATCECQHNTAGNQCDQCLPKFNDRAWAMGTPSASNLCIECDCNGYATTCYYDSDKGQGVCNNCTDNTAGDTCYSCVTGFYINPERVSNDSATNTTTTTTTTAAPGAIDNLPPYCLVCGCNENGTQASSLSTCDVTTGQCACKERVNQRDCSECQDTFWGLSATNSLGCDVCSCNAQGSLGSSNMCNKTSGACLCKTYVDGIDCSQCKPNTFNFDPANPDGCTPCDCDPGASLDGSCDLATGQCSCYSNIGGRDCSTPTSGFYVPRMDAMVVEPESFTTENVVLRSGHGLPGSDVSGRGLVVLSPANQIMLTFDATISGSMDLVVRYEKISGDNFVILQGTLNLTSGGDYSCAGTTIPAGQQWRLTFSNLKDGARGGVSLGKVCINAGSSYSLRLTNPGSALLIDSIVLIPDITMLAPLAGRIPIDNITRCSQSAMNEVRANRGDCADVEYSVMAAILQGAKACSCAGGSVLDNTCDPYSGDCNCRPGVLAPKCSECMVDQHQFSVETGCIACGCHPNGSAVDYCDNDGVCQCLTNVQGDKCDSCLDQHYGLYTGAGCSPCQCNLMYSLDNNCDDQGNCSCVAGVAGPLCNACMDGHYNLTIAGCTQCACDPDGSTDRSCDVTTGNCECLPQVEGSTCDVCKPGHFGLGSWHPDGCLQCFCWGHGLECSSAIGYVDSAITSSWPLSNLNGLTDFWTAEDEDGEMISVQTVMSQAGDSYLMRIDAPQLSDKDIYFVSPQLYAGDRKSSYGRYLTFVFTPSPSSSLQTLSSSSLSVLFGGVDDTRGDVVLQGMYTDVSLVYKFSNVTRVDVVGTLMTVKIPITERLWQAATSVPSPNNANQTDYVMSSSTYGQVIGLLSSLATIKIKAYRANVTNSSFDLISVSLDSAVFSNDNSSSDVAVNNVEMCQCGVAYTGNSCEQCAIDYTRATPNNTNPGSPCVPCACNSHGVTECDPRLLGNCSRDPQLTSCDPVSGVCQCQHNTMGDHCEMCMPGYYGDPLKGTPDDCKPCACPGIVIANETNVFATSCVQNETYPEPICVDCREGHVGSHCELCTDGYYGTPENATNNGGMCVPCECNDRADTCDTRTGECVDCRNDTAGQTCEKCAPGFFGDPMEYVCQPCTCQNLTGSTGECDDVTGVCECLPNVSGDLCDLCDDMTFNLTAEIGCEPCDCSGNGSLSMICDKTSGQCPCRSLVQGRQCDECQDSYWNVNVATGCDACLCTQEGTALVNGTVDETCDVITGQCSCTLPGIVGRTCDVCSPVSTFTFEYVELFYIGAYPNCELCGECFDSWANRIEDVGREMADMENTVVEIWGRYDNRSADQVRATLDDIAQKINQTRQSLMDVEVVAQKLQMLQGQFTETLAKQTSLTSEVDMLTSTEQTLSTSVNALTLLTEAVRVTNSTLTSLSGLRNELDTLGASALTSTQQGNASYIEIESLSFVVASPADRERQLRQQAQKSMQIAALANQTYTLTKTLYETSISPSVGEKAREFIGIGEKIANATMMLAEVTSTIATVQSDANMVGVALTPLVDNSTTARADLLDAVYKLQAYGNNASIAQRSADKVLKEAIVFKNVTENAEEIMMNSMTAVLENLAALTQAQLDLVKSQTQSIEVQGVQIPSEADLTALVDQIDASAVSQEDIDTLSLHSQRAMMVAEEAVRNTQTALKMSRELNEEVKLMQSDIMESRDLRVRALGLRMAADSLNTSIQAVLQQATSYNDKVDTDVTNITQSAQEVQAEIRNVTSCFAQRQLDVTNAVTSSNQVQARAQTASNAQLSLLQVMFTVSTAEPNAENAQVLANLTQASSEVSEMTTSMDALEEWAQLEALIQELVSQNQEMNDLNLEIDQLTSDLDSIILSLQESDGGTSCTNTET